MSTTSIIVLVVVVVIVLALVGFSRHGLAVNGNDVA